MSRAAAHARWLAGAAVALGSAVLALVAPTSAWGLTFIVGVVVLMLGLRPVVPASYRGTWTRSVVLVSVTAALAGLCYAFAVEPWGPEPWVAWPLGVLLLVLLFTTVADMVPAGARADVLYRQQERVPRELLTRQERGER